MIFSFFQQLAIIITNLIGALFLNFEVRGVQNLDKLNGKALFISNHHGAIDPFLVSAAIPGSYYKKIKCLRYLTYYKYIRRRPYGIFIWLMGAYSIVPGKNKNDYEKILGKTVKLLKQDQSVLMFPTGKLERDFDPKNARPGVAYLAKTVNPVIVPVYIKDTYKIGLKDFYLRKRRVSVEFGEPFRYREAGDSNLDLNTTAELIMKEVDRIGKNEF
jgi:1-acyl-sn-glycerol-3-phosphate acyltransferase